MDEYDFIPVAPFVLALVAIMAVVGSDDVPSAQHRLLSQAGSVASSGSSKKMAELIRNGQKDLTPGKWVVTHPLSAMVVNELPPASVILPPSPDIKFLVVARWVSDWKKVKGASTRIRVIGPKIRLEIPKKKWKKYDLPRDTVIAFTALPVPNEVKKSPIKIVDYLKMRVISRPAAPK